MGFAHDHTIWLVPDPSRLDAVCERFRAAGFSVSRRDDADADTAATAQRLICFADGSYIEILTIRDPEARKRHRFAPLLALGEGWADYSLVTDDLQRAKAGLQVAGLPCAGPFTHSRSLRDGRRWGVSLIQPGIGAGNPALPFILEDTECRDLRIPGDATKHRNGVTGTLSVNLAVADLAPLRAGMTALGIGKGVLREDGGLILALANGGRIAARAGAAQGELSVARGDGVVSVTFARPGSGAEAPLRDAEAEGLAGFRAADPSAT